jgi:hypothetical protein
MNSYHYLVETLTVFSLLSPERGEGRDMASHERLKWRFNEGPPEAAIHQHFICRAFFVWRSRGTLTASIPP